MNFGQTTLLAVLRIYRWVGSPAKTIFFGPVGRCRYTPSCSSYAIEAVRTHGTVFGTWLGIKRLCRCHPWGGCGFDPVPAAPSHASTAGNEGRDRLGSRIGRWASLRNRLRPAGNTSSKQGGETPDIGESLTACCPPKTIAGTNSAGCR